MRVSGTLFLLLFVGAVVLCGCSVQDNSTPSKYQIAVILLQGDQFYRLNEAGMKAAAKKYNVELLVDNSQGKIDRELALVDAYIAKGVDALLVPPKSQTGSVNALRRAYDAGIKIIVYDLALGADFPDCTIISDQVGLGASTGKEARRYIEENLGGKANIAIAAMVISGTAALASALTFGGPVWLTILCVLIWGASILPDSAQFSALVADYAPPDQAGSLMSFQTALGFALTFFTVQLTPLGAELIGWPGVFVLMAIGPAFGILGMLRLKRLS